MMERDENGSGWIGFGLLELGFELGFNRGKGDRGVVGDVEVNLLSVEKNPFDDCLLATCGVGGNTG